jgi:hypothetical protein
MHLKRQNDAIIPLDGVNQQTFFFAPVFGAAGGIQWHVFLSWGNGTKGKRGGGLGNGRAMRGRIVFWKMISRRLMIRTIGQGESHEATVSRGPLFWPRQGLRQEHMC